MKVQQIFGGFSCAVLWDRLDGRPWEKDPNPALADKHSGFYSCGAGGKFHLALSAVQAINENVSKLAVYEERCSQTQDPTMWDSELKMQVQVKGQQHLDDLRSRTDAIRNGIDKTYNRINMQLQELIELCENKLLDAKGLVGASEETSKEEATAPVAKTEETALVILLQGIRKEQRELPRGGAPLDRWLLRAAVAAFRRLRKLETEPPADPVELLRERDASLAEALRAFELARRAELEGPRGGRKPSAPARARFAILHPRRARTAPHSRA